MRHRKKAKLAIGKDYSRRKMRQYSNALVLHERIETTAATGKLIRSHVEKLITKGKLQTVATRRAITTVVGPKATKIVVDTMAKEYENRKGGFTRIIKSKTRLSDGSKMAIIAFVK